MVSTANKKPAYISIPAEQGEDGWRGLSWLVALWFLQPIKKPAFISALAEQEEGWRGLSWLVALWLLQPIENLLNAYISVPAEQGEEGWRGLSWLVALWLLQNRGLSWLDAGIISTANKKPPYMYFSPARARRRGVKGTVLIGPLLFPEPIKTSLYFNPGRARRRGLKGTVLIGRPMVSTANKIPAYISVPAEQGVEGWRGLPWLVALLFLQPIKNLLIFQSRQSKEKRGEGDCSDWSTVVSTANKNLLIFQSRQSKEKRGEGDCPDWSPYGCHYQPDPEEFPVPRIGKQLYFSEIKSLDRKICWITNPAIFLKFVFCIIGEEYLN
jgi:hypothetical protein